MSPAGRVKPDRARAAWLLGVVVGCVLIGIGLVALHGSVLPFTGWPSPQRPAVGETALAQLPAEEAPSATNAGSGGGTNQGEGTLAPAALGPADLPVGAAGTLGPEPLRSSEPTSETVEVPQDNGAPPSSQPEAQAPLPDDFSLPNDTPLTVVDVGPSADEGSANRDPRLSRGRAQEGDDDPPVDEKPASSGADNPAPPDVPASSDAPAVSVPDVTAQLPVQPPVAAPAPAVPTPGAGEAGSPPAPPTVEEPPAQDQQPPLQSEEDPPAAGEQPPGDDEQPPADTQNDDGYHQAPQPPGGDGGYHHAPQFPGGDGGSGHHQYHGGYGCHQDS